MPTAYPTEFKIKVIRRYEKGESIKSIRPCLKNKDV